MPVTAKQRRVFEFIRRYMESNQEPPTIAEIGRQFQMSSSASVHSILSNLEREGLIKRIPNVNRVMTENSFNWLSRSHNTQQRNLIPFLYLRLL